MRLLVLSFLFAAAGCFDPHVTAGGFSCDPANPQCPDGEVCRDGGRGVYLCVAPSSVPPAGSDLAVGAAGDMAVPDRGDLALPGRGDLAGAPPDDLTRPPPGDLAQPPPQPDLAQAPADLSQPAVCTETSLVINEVNTTPSSSLRDQWIELYNPCANSITTGSSWEVHYKSRAGGTSGQVVPLGNVTIQAKSWYLIADNAGPSNADIFGFGTGAISSSSGGLAILGNSGNIINSMGWGQAANGYQHGTPAVNSNPNGSMARIPDGKNSGVNDSDNFTNSANPTPRTANMP